MRILITTDAFPPIAGGSGWSSYYLARALRSRGHKIAIVKATLRNDGIREEEYDGFKVVEFGIDYRKIPIFKRFRKRGYFFSPFYRFLRDKARGFKPEIIHAQHQLTAPPSIEVGDELKIPVVVTVRDYWPLCFHSTGLKGDEPCPGCSISNIASCFYRRFPGLTPFLPLLIPFALSNLRFKQEMLKKAAKIIAVSHHIKGELKMVFPEEKIAVIPNMIDSDTIEKISSEPPDTKIKGEFLLYVGKLSINKGVRLIPELMRRLNIDLPLIIAGEGPLREELEKKGELFGLNLIFTGWLSNEEAIRLMRRTKLLLFPSAWGEPLSRVLLEALSLGAVVAAINTGGTGDIIDDEVDGLLAADFEEWVVDVKRIIADPGLSKRLAEGAKEKARKRFDALVVAPRFEDLYRRIISSSNQGTRP
jgi:glycogen(starch) synthase